MKIAIHKSRGAFHDRWRTYCDANQIAYKDVDCYRSDIIDQLADCDALMWHFHQGNPKDILFAKQLLFSVESAGKKVFPDYKTMWHFDDKVGQKYLLESIGAPLVQSYVSYDKQEALEWVRNSIYPLVFKLRGGAGSQNVQLVKNREQGQRIVKQAFGKGFSPYPAWSNLKERIRKFRCGNTTFFDVLKGVGRLVHPPEYADVTGKQKGYVYFQEFIPGNDSDIRVIVIGCKAFAIKRMVRENDFRASGSGTILYDKNLFDDATIKLSFDLSEKLQTQCVAFDYVYKDGQPLVVEISYGFSPQGYDACVGYWDKEMVWHAGPFNPYGWMVEEVLR